MNKQNLKNWLKSFGLLIVFILAVTTLYYSIELLYHVLSAKGACILLITILTVSLTGIIKEMIYDKKF